MRNNGDEQATGLTLQLPTGYLSTKGTTLGNLAPKDSLVFDVSFVPTASGLYNNDLVIKRTDNSTTVKALTGKVLARFGINHTAVIWTILSLVCSLPLMEGIC